MLLLVIKFSIRILQCPIMSLLKCLFPHSMADPALHGAMHPVSCITSQSQCWCGAIQSGALWTYSKRKNPPGDLDCDVLLVSICDRVGLGWTVSVLRLGHRDPPSCHHRHPTAKFITAQTTDSVQDRGAGIAITAATHFIKILLNNHRCC